MSPDDKPSLSALIVMSLATMPFPPAPLDVALVPDAALDPVVLPAVVLATELPVPPPPLPPPPDGSVVVLVPLPWHPASEDHIAKTPVSALVPRNMNLLRRIMGSSKNAEKARPEWPKRAALGLRRNSEWVSPSTNCVQSGIHLTVSASAHVATASRIHEFRNEHVRASCADQGCAAEIQRAGE